MENFTPERQQIIRRAVCACLQQTPAVVTDSRMIGVEIESITGDSKYGSSDDDDSGGGGGGGDGSDGKGGGGGGDAGGDAGGGGVESGGGWDRTKCAPDPLAHPVLKAYSRCG